MNKKIIKYIIELIFIFIIPLGLLATCFKQEKVYDENSNEVGKYLTFDNIFVLTNESKIYYEYDYYTTLGQYFTLRPGDSILLNYNKAPYITGTNGNYYFYTGDDLIWILQVSSDFQYVSYSENANWEVEYNDFYVRLTRLGNSNAVLINNDLNVVKEMKTYTISDNVINRFISYIYDTLGITTNWVLQFIVIYTLLWLVMWFIWHLIYIPIDFLVSHLLIDKVDR